MNAPNSENLEQAVVQTTNNLDLSVMSLVLSADLVGKIVIILLVLASIWSWTIIINKLIKYTTVKAKMANFESLFWSGQVLDELYEKVKKAIDNPLSAVFVNALNECKKIKLLPIILSQIL